MKIVITLSVIQAMDFCIVLCVQVHEDHLKHVTVYWSGVDNTVHPANYEDDIEILPEDDSASSNGE